MNEIMEKTYRTHTKMKMLLENAGFDFKTIDLYPKELSRYEDTHEYALIYKKK